MNTSRPRLRRKPRTPSDPDDLAAINRSLERENLYLRQENSALKREVAKLENLQRSTMDMIQREARRKEWRQ